MLFRRRPLLSIQYLPDLDHFLVTLSLYFRRSDSFEVLSLKLMVVLQFPWP